jgi:hypothetical protein
MATGISCIIVSGAMGTQELFVSFYNYLISAQAQAVGVTLKASNYGLVYGGMGTGFDYWDQANPTGNNAWALFQWASASVPFYTLLQVATGSGVKLPQSFGDYPGNPGAIYQEQITNYDGVGIQFAALANKGDPWNGTSGSLGSDTKGSPVWTSGSSVLYVWPRSNNVSGTHNTVKDFCATILTTREIRPSVSTNANSQIHLTIDENNFHIAKNTFGATTLSGAYGYQYFGKYNVFSGSHREDMVCNPDVPYVMLWLDKNMYNYGHNPSVHVDFGSISVAGESHVYGLLDGIVLDALNGGVAYPSINESEKNLGVVQCVIGSLGTWPYDNAFNPNYAFPTASYDEYPILVFMNEYLTQNFAMLGQIEFMRLICGVNVGTTNSDMSRICFGSTGSSALSRYTVPWSGVAPPNLIFPFGDRTGSIY